MDKLTLPVFEMPELPPKPISLVVWQEANAELVKRLKEAGEYDRLQQSPAHTPASVPFCLRE